MRHETRIAVTRNTYRILFGKTEPFGRIRNKWKDTIKMDVKGIGCEDMNWVYLAHV
jgi:hypothetical protein